jgi:hypothetical protein
MEPMTCRDGEEFAANSELAELTACPHRVDVSSAKILQRDASLAGINNAKADSTKRMA